MRMAAGLLFLLLACLGSYWLLGASPPEADLIPATAADAGSADAPPVPAPKAPGSERIEGYGDEALAARRAAREQRRQEIRDAALARARGESAGEAPDGEHLDSGDAHNGW